MHKKISWRQESRLPRITHGQAASSPVNQKILVESQFNHTVALPYKKVKINTFYKIYMHNELDMMYRAINAVQGSYAGTDYQ